MPTVDDAIRRTLPNGTGTGSTISWSRCPAWPPDLFCVVGSLLQRSGAYASPDFASPWSPSYLFTKPYLDRVARAGSSWRRTGQPPRRVARLWRALLARRPLDVRADVSGWASYAMELFAIADCACEGVGFVPPKGKETESIFSFVVYREYKASLRRRATLPHLPFSLAKLASPDEVCVQPKSRTPQVGCTLRSLSHHLALLPGRGEFETKWLIADSAGADPDDGNGKLNLLAVPFPYRITGNCFVPAADAVRAAVQTDTRDFFGLDPRWLRRLDGTAVTTRELSSFVQALIAAAERQVSHVDGVVFPECALTERMAASLARTLARESRLSLFISGVIDEAQNNSVFSALFLNRKLYTYWLQGKHHRWKLDESQVRRYQLGDALDPSHTWWERIEVAKRVCWFYVARGGATLSTLICEDLARVDPVQAALRAIGPNLVVALLMDGAQRGYRWPGRYATVLAEDPGSAVLTLTSLGMSLRGDLAGDPANRCVALWKEPGGETQELRLQPGDHGLVLTLVPMAEEQFTLDGRSDSGASVRFILGGVHGVQAPSDAVRWLT